MTEAAPAPTVGIDLGGTNLRVGVVDADGRVVDECRVPAPKALDDLADAVRGAFDEVATAEPAAVGVGAAGMIDRDGVVHYAPNLPMFVERPAAHADRGRGAAPGGGRQRRQRRRLGRGVPRRAARPHQRPVHHAGHRDRRRHHRRRTAVPWRARLRRGGRPLAARSERTEVRVRRDRPLGGVRLRHRARAARTCAGRGRPRSRSARTRGWRRRRASAGCTSATARRRASPTAPRSSPSTPTSSPSASPGSATSSTPRSSWCRVVSSSSVTCCSTRCATRSRGHLEGSAYRPVVPIVAGELGEAAGVVGAAALARDLVRRR